MDAFIKKGFYTIGALKTNRILYAAYGEATEEYHNELYEILEFQQWLNDYKTGRPQRPYLYVKKVTQGHGTLI